ncbi:MAG TPA: zinc-dependent metalloprotease, partial [Phycisphaerales bacterium]|nr:zinc-dependent metalloprotease [Phycisphaerales bacterium]
RDPKLKMSPPKDPIVYYIEYTVPVRYRRWIRDGILYWNEAFKAVGLDGAIEVQFQDKETGANMDKDPEDVRYNFIRWLNNDISTAIGPHRANPMTGEILDADVVLTDGWIRAYWSWYNEQAPELATEGMSAETLDWLEGHPDWDPRMLLSTPDQRKQILALRAQRALERAAGQEVSSMSPALELNKDLAAIEASMGSKDDMCMAAHGLAFDMAFAPIALQMEGLLDDAQSAPDAPKSDDEKLDGIPEWFVGPLLSELVCHEVGHTLGLRHNFKASSLYTMEQVNSEEFKGKKPLAGSVMDYLPPNFNLGSGKEQGDFSMISIGPYDKWAIEYGYTFDDPKKVVSRVATPELAYLTDDDTDGPDPFARRYDFSAKPIEYAQNMMRIVAQHRGKILDKFVKEGQSWSRARTGYEMALGMQLRVVSMMSGWVGGAHVNRDRKGDPNGRLPVEVVSTAEQRAALQFVIDNALNDAAFGLTPDLLAHMTVDKWSDDSPGDRGESAYPVHDRVMAVQASVLSMLMNPTTLRRVYDNEFRTAADQDCVTLAEVMQKVNDAVYTELNTGLDGATYTNRKPMISSLRRNLQSGLTDRLIDLAGGDRAMPRTIRTLAAMHLRTLNDKLDGLLAKSNGGQMDEYTLAHLQDLKVRVDRALKTIQVTTGP